ncbi:unnamed protein product [Adineta steineri]|uniref:C2H2-type domain-containing protein n=1 Tax=Adineta steineri TaxID=433720 RepID=A0A814HW09_9BILA|nr:unnamed protein product [Adineta steineri]CAF3792154.1 unnamed protein product [Adineta steineri]CAF4166567.1 unnamed protein product [Adineta steineri]
MYTFGITTSRCSLCYALLSTNISTNSSSIGYSSSNRRHGNRCSVASIERVLTSSKKFQKLWHKNDNGIINTRLICFRCCDTIRQIEQIQNHIEQLNNDQDILMNKIEHNLYKRSLILQGQRHRTNSTTPFIFNHQQIPINEDDDTEEGEEKPRTVTVTNGYGHTSPLVVSTTTLVGAKRRKSKIAHRINTEDKSSLLNHSRQSNSPISHPLEKFSPTLLFSPDLAKHHRTGIFSTGLNGHANDLANLSFGSAYKSLTLPAAAAANTPPFIDPTTGALIAIVSNPHHAALLAQQHQQILKSSSSISPSSTNTIDEHDITAPKTTIPQQLQKKFPCLLCGRDFSNKSNLNRHHSIVHVALRNFECVRCPKKFKLRQGLKTHMQRCHGVNADEPTFVLQKHHAHNHHHHHHHSSFAQSK